MITSRGRRAIRPLLASVIWRSNFSEVHAVTGPTIIEIGPTSEVALPADDNRELLAKLPIFLYDAPMQAPPHYVLTGGPCAGKTTTIDELARRGYPILAEPARLIIDEKLAAGQTITEIVTDPDWLPSVVRRAYAQESSVPNDELFFFDRAIPDSLAYYTLAQRPLEDFFLRAMKEIRYRKIFFLDLVDFTNDEGRPETPEQAAALHKLIREGYESQGYELVSVPVMPVQERVEFILARL